MMGQTVVVGDGPERGVVVGRAQMRSGRLLYAVAPEQAVETKSLAEAEDVAKWHEGTTLTRVAGEAPDLSGVQREFEKGSNEAERP